MKRKLEGSERIFKIISYVLLTVFALCCLYPFVYAVSSSISSRYAVDHGDITLVPGESSPGYRLADGSTLWMEELTAARVKANSEEETKTCTVWAAEWPDGKVTLLSGEVTDGNWTVTVNGAERTFTKNDVESVPADGVWFIRLTDGTIARVSREETGVSWYLEADDGTRTPAAAPSNTDEYPAWGVAVDGQLEWLDREDVARNLAKTQESSVVHLLSEPSRRVWTVRWPGTSGSVTLDNFPGKASWGVLEEDGTVTWGSAAEGKTSFQLINTVSKFNLVKGVQFDAFKSMFNNDMFWNAYSNTIFLTIYGTVWSLFVAILGGYALSKKRLLFRKFFNFFLVFTMWFSAGIVPQLINYRNTQTVFKAVGIFDDKWLIVIAMGMAAMNIILLRNAFENVPSEIEEASIVDGATEFQVMTRVFIPMSKSTIATVALFFAISRWNGYFWAKQMISNEYEKPLQVFINQTLTYYFDGENTAGWSASYSWQSVIYALIVCSIVPILIIYPFIQKYFAKGTNAGGVKE